MPPGPHPAGRTDEIACLHGKPVPRTHPCMSSANGGETQNRLTSKAPRGAQLEPRWIAPMAPAGGVSGSAAVRGVGRGVYVMIRMSVRLRERWDEPRAMCAPSFEAVRCWHLSLSLH